MKRILNERIRWNRANNQARSVIIWADLLMRLLQANVTTTGISAGANAAGTNALLPSETDDHVIVQLQKVYALLELGETTSAVKLAQSTVQQMPSTRTLVIAFLTGMSPPCSLAHCTPHPFLLSHMSSQPHAPEQLQPYASNIQYHPPVHSSTSLLVLHANGGVAAVEYLLSHLPGTITCTNTPCTNTPCTNTPCNNGSLPHRLINTPCNNGSLPHRLINTFLYIVPTHPAHC